MIKKFNENWTTFDNFLNDQSPEEKKMYWDQYWNRMSKDIDFEMDTISDFAKKNSISYEEALEYFKKDDYKTKFDSGFSIVGLPSGQIIYMNNKQVKYFKARKFIKWVEIWKKPIVGGFIPIKINSYCFEDKFYKEIMETIKTFIW